MVDLTDTSKISTMEGHDAPVLCVRFDPLVKYLVSSIVHLDVHVCTCTLLIIMIIIIHVISHQYNNDIYMYMYVRLRQVVMVQLRYGQ